MNIEMKRSLRWIASGQQTSLKNVKRKEKVDCKLSLSNTKNYFIYHVIFETIELLFYNYAVQHIMYATALYNMSLLTAKLTMQLDLVPQ